MTIILSNKKSQYEPAIPYKGEGTYIKDESVWSLTLDDNNCVHFSQYVMNTGDTIKTGCLGHGYHNRVINFYASENIQSDTPLVARTVDWELDALQTKCVNDRTDVPIGPIAITLSWSEKYALEQLCYRNLDATGDEMAEKLNEFYRKLDDIRGMLDRGETNIDSVSMSLRIEEIYDEAMARMTKED